MSTNFISGLSSGFDWESVVTQLIQIEHKKVDLIDEKKTATEKKLTEWQSFNTKLLALKTASGNLKEAADFNLFTASMTTDNSDVDGTDLLTVTASETASVGSYALKINNLAAAQKLSSGSFASNSTALGTGYAGDILINGTVITVAATDTLKSVMAKINNANSGTDPTGVTASIISYSSNDYRLVLTSDETGADGIGLLNGGASDVLSAFGFTDTARTAKNHLAGGDQTDRFTSTNISIQALLGLTDAQASAAGDIVINGHSVGDIDLSTDTLATLQTKLAGAGLTVSVTTETEDNQAYYRLLVSGSANTYTDKNNILETLGLIKGGVSDVYGVTGNVANTAGGTAITADTLLKDIDGYTGYLNTDYIHLEGTNTNGVGVSDDSLTISDTTTVGDLLAKIESVFGDVTASVTGDGKISIVDNTPGTSPLAVKIGAKNSGGGDDTTLLFDTDGDLGSATSVRKRQIVAGADASVTVDGVTVTRSTNTINDILTGVTLDLLKADTGTTVNLEVGRDIDAIVSNITTFVTNYNAVSSYIKQQSTYDETTQKTGGVLFGDGTLASVKSSLTTLLVQNVWGVSSEFSTLGLVGVNVDRQGQLSIDDDKLRDYLTTNFNDIQKLFTANGTASVGALEYISHDNQTKEGEYTVHITTAATQSTSAASDNTSLSGDESLTITEGENVATVNLTSSMTMSQIVNAINSELATVYTQSLAGGEQLYADGTQSATITASTKWNSVYDSTGGSANIADGDVITFSGTNHNGTSISGSYSITNAATDSVQGLLSAIETAYGNDVTAAINASGKIVITDKTTGKSDLSLNLNYAQAHDLDFGSALATNPDGQEGRYAMSITALADATNHLVLNHDTYGTGHSFTIHQANNLLWTGGDQTVNNGVDVAGTINGEAATGSGQVLTGDSGDANVDGLSIKYTGTASGVDVGTIKLTFGVAELYDRALFTITDSIEGYVPFKEESLQNSINDYETQIDEMEARLALKQELMINQFTQMELAIQKIQSQSSWLSSQIEAAKSGWA
ncbi:MAG: flagellar filament capping protein FliD [Deltaproteobacteria bacterium]|nr:flagellar filament capping protein FliD [Deltaproteobacteria bacterium]